MPSKTITVRFNDALYDKIKNHPMNTSELIRTSIRQYFRKMEQDYNNVKHDSTPSLQHVEQVSQPVLQEKNNDIEPPKEDVFFSSYREDNINSSKKEEIKRGNSTVDELRTKIDELDAEIDEFINMYRKYKE